MCWKTQARKRICVKPERDAQLIKKGYTSPVHSIHFCVNLFFLAQFLAKNIKNYPYFITENSEVYVEEQPKTGFSLS